MIQAIETVYKGYRFRSRAEARWAIFFEYAGISFDYEPEGVVLDGASYLPDFWLPDAQTWFEVKGADPTPQERNLCSRLAAESARQCLLAVGPPSITNFIYRFSNMPDDWLGDGQSKFQFCGMNGGLSLEEHNGGNYIKILPDCRSISKAYEAAHSARFEHGESGAVVKAKTFSDLHRAARHSWGPASPELRAKIREWSGKK